MSLLLSDQNPQGLGRTRMQGVGRTSTMSCFSSWESPTQTLLEPSRPSFIPLGGGVGPRTASITEMLVMRVLNGSSSGEW